MRSNNTCPACKHSYRSRYHATHCGGKSLSQWKASKIGHSIRQSTVKRTAGEIFASQHIGAEIYRPTDDPIQEALQ
ncbi:MAG: hypothetical protein ACOYM3_01245 [Terrimicrobiaceae bacterium]